jgi:hypothetical protein
MHYTLCTTTVREYLRGKYHCTVDLLFDWFGISCMTTDNFCLYLQRRLIQTSQTGGQRYSDTSPFCIPATVHGQTCASRMKPGTSLEDAVCIYFSCSTYQTAKLIVAMHYRLYTTTISMSIRHNYKPISMAITHNYKPIFMPITHN